MFDAEEQVRRPLLMIMAAYNRLNGKMTWFEVETGALNGLCQDYDILDDDTVAAAEVRDGGLEHHGERYSTVILPACVVLEEPTARAALSSRSPSSNAASARLVATQRRWCATPPRIPSSAVSCRRNIATKLPWYSLITSA